jgi:hypothetical protein
MAYKISGNLTEDSRIYVINESNHVVEKTEEKSSGSYEITGLVSGSKFISARKSDGEGLAYGNITPAAYWSPVGLTWNESTDSYTRTEGLVGETLSVSPGNAKLPIHALMKRCTLLDNGTVNYYLDPTDSTQKAAGGAADLTGTDGQVMVEIPKFYYKYSYAGTSHTWEISLTQEAGFTLHPAFTKNGVEVDHRYIGAYEGSMWDATTSNMVSDANAVTQNFYAAGDKLCSVVAQCPKTYETRAEFRAMGSERGSGWRQMDYDLVSAIQLLYLTEYADFNSQSTIGMGRTERTGTWVVDSYIGRTGKSNGDGNGTNSVGGNTNNAYMTYRGIENFFGNVWKWMDGINVNNNIPYVSNNDSHWADDTVTNYTNLGVTLANTADYQKTLEQISRGFLPASVGGTSSTYICDFYYQASGWRVAVLGGAATSGIVAGVFCLALHDASSFGSVAIAGRLCY